MPTWNRLFKAFTNSPARLREERGQALVEFAVVLPVLLLIIVGILYFGRYEDYSNQMTQLAEQAVRYASVDVDPSSTLTLQNYVKTLAQPELQNGSSDVSAVRIVLTCSGTCTSTTGNPTVTACLYTTVQFPYLNIGAPQVVQKATMRIEQPQTASSPSTNTGWAVDSTTGTPC